MNNFILPELSFALDGLEPVLSRETLEYHYGKHHAGYIEKLNELIAGTKFENQDIAEIIINSEGAVYNNASQACNHAFYWKCMRPPVDDNKPLEKLAVILDNTFGSFEEFRKKFGETAKNHFGSGWVWLVQNSSGMVDIIALPDAGTPITNGSNPLFVLDIWEHAYYIDYRNRRSDYIAEFWRLVNWDFVESRLDDLKYDNLLIRQK